MTLVSEHIVPLCPIADIAALARFKPLQVIRITARGNSAGFIVLQGSPLPLPCPGPHLPASIPLQALFTTLLNKKSMGSHSAIEKHAPPDELPAAGDCQVTVEERSHLFQLPAMP